jgi:hypothetical protein
MPGPLASPTLCNSFHSVRIRAIPTAEVAVKIMASISLNGLQRGTTVVEQSGSTWLVQDSHWPAVSTVPAHPDSGCLVHRYSRPEPGKVLGPPILRVIGDQSFGFLHHPGPGRVTGTHFVLGKRSHGRGCRNPGVLFVILPAAEHGAHLQIRRRILVQYLLLIYADETGWSKLSQEEQEQRVSSYREFTEAMTKAGVLKGADRLQPTSNATTIRVVSGKSQVLDGPFAETKEQLGGYYLIDVPDLDAAISWAARCPGASHGAVEIRPSWRSGFA